MKHIGTRIILVTWEPGNTGTQAILITWEPGNTGKPVRMTQNNIVSYGNSVRMIWNWPRIYYMDPTCRRAARSGDWRDLTSMGKESIFGICILKKLNIAYILESWLWGIFTKKTRAEKWWNLAAVSRRDLSYETDSGPKTKTVKTSHMGSSVLFVYRHMLLFLSQRSIF